MMGVHVLVRGEYTDVVKRLDDYAINSTTEDFIRSSSRSNYCVLFSSTQVDSPAYTAGFVIVIVVGIIIGVLSIGILFSFS